jgi:hypothetical protein
VKLESKVRLHFSGLYLSAVFIDPDISEEIIAFIFRVGDYAKQEAGSRLSLNMEGDMFSEVQGFIDQKTELFSFLTFKCGHRIFLLKNRYFKVLVKINIFLSEQ